MFTLGFVYFGCGYRFVTCFPLVLFYSVRLHFLFNTLLQSIYAVQHYIRCSCFLFLLSFYFIIDGQGRRTVATWIILIVWFGSNKLFSIVIDRLRLVYYWRFYTVALRCEIHFYKNASNLFIVRKSHFTSHPHFGLNLNITKILCTKMQNENIAPTHIRKKKNISDVLFLEVRIHIFGNRFWIWINQLLLDKLFLLHSSFKPTGKMVT